MKKIKTVFLHVGSDKTGSTAIQNTLHQNREILSELGYLYASEVHHVLMATHFAKQPLELDYFKIRTTTFNLKKVKEKATQFIANLKSEIEKSSSSYLVLSYEGFTGLTESELGELKFFLDIYAENIKVIYYLRPPQSYATSAISQRVKYGKPSWHIHPPINLYRPRLTALINIFGKKNINLRNYERKLLTSGDVVIDFLQQIGINGDSTSKIKRANIDSNTALSEEAILIGDEIIRLVREMGLDGEQFNKLFLPTLEKVKGRKYVLSQLQQTVIERATKNDIEYIRSEFGLSISDEVSLSESDPQRLSKDFIHSIARIIINHVLPEFNIPDTDIDYFHNESVIENAEGKVIIDMNEGSIIMNAGQQESLKVQVFNDSNTRWGGWIAPVKVSYHWYSSNKELIIFDGVRTELPYEGLAPDTSININMNILSPLLPGNYVLEITLVQEYFNWFENIGFESQFLNVKVM